ncbi:phage tail assembly protein [Bordetella hinzii]|uniref:phage tail assembly protein n=1 Tax=Bordetella hinzii TaxID=103855 RepID=UPI000764AE1A|nr:phage tail assembly protein [Bordetella hinzii]KXA71053.1 hypothetical protein AXA74_20335 [Bordetella hinzii LMG 13501]VEH23162.1 Uncharacterised protein [Bordetella hinzii]
MTAAKQDALDLGAARVEIKLDFPVEMDGVQVGVLRMRRAKVRDQLTAQRQANNDPAKTEVFLFALLCEIAPASLDDMDICDYEKLRETYAGFRAGLSPKEP